MDDRSKRDPSLARLTPEERYRRDATFAALVDTLAGLIHAADFTPTELREAAMLACVRHELLTFRSEMTGFYLTREQVEEMKSRYAVARRGLNEDEKTDILHGSLWDSSIDGPDA